MTTSLICPYCEKENTLDLTFNAKDTHVSFIHKCGGEDPLVAKGCKREFAVVGNMKLVCSVYKLGKQK